MIGARFGRLVVIEQAPKIDRYARVRCRCDCGALTEVRGTHLRSGHSRSCGCGRQRCAPAAELINSHNPLSEVGVRDMKTGEITPVSYKPGII